jgi:broad specificity phosphatase PhoE
LHSGFFPARLVYPTLVENSHFGRGTTSIKSTFVPNAMRATRFLLIRHGESESNAGRSTHPDSALTTTGIGQARGLAQRLHHYELGGHVALTSPYRRAVETANVIGNALGIVFQTEELIREWGSEAIINGRHYPEDSKEQLVARLSNFIDLYRGKQCIVVSHAAPIAVLMQLMRNQVPDMREGFWKCVGNCCLVHEERVEDAGDQAVRRLE